MRSFFRFLAISWQIYRFGLSELFALLVRSRLLKFWFKLHPIPRKVRHLPVPVRLRLTLTSLGPIYVKFGQVLSTRPDILPPEYIEELSKLQDQVPPFDSDEAIAIIEKDFGKKINELYYEFKHDPVASASIAQVHEAWLFAPDGGRGRKVAVKVLRPGIRNVIEKDLNLIKNVAKWVEKVFKDGKRLKPKEVVAEFDKYLHDEINLHNEAANCSLLGRQFKNSDKLIIPDVFFDLCTNNVLTIEWVSGISISDIDALKRKNIDLKRLGRFGVEIFFTMVFDNGFFHADMHPGNIFVSDDGRYMAIDFGIVGTLTDYDKRYLAINLLAFFNRDYHRVATAHIESGWVPYDTRAEELESAVRSVCEPIFNKPLAEISFGMVLMRLFETSRRFNVEIQPQLVLLQKTLLNVEGLGRQLDPDLDLWKTAKPFMTKWMSQEVGYRSFINNVQKEAANWSKIFPALPRKVNAYIDKMTRPDDHYTKVIEEMRRTRRLVGGLIGLMSAIIVMLLFVVLLK